MVSAKHSRLHLSPRAIQLLVIAGMIAILSWPTIIQLMQSYSAELTTYVMPAVMMVLAAVVLFQQWQLSRLANKMQRVEGMTREALAVDDVPLPATQLTHFDADQFFFRGQTKH